MEKQAKIYVAGHRGLVGSAIVRSLEKQGYANIIKRTHDELDLTKQEAVERFFREEAPEYVFLAAAKVGGIQANATAPAQFFYVNEMIQCNVIHNAYMNGAKKLLFLGSSCIYPKNAPQPMPESALLSGYLEPTNEAYAIAKISGIKMCQYYRKQYGANFISCMPTNLYGPNDNFDLGSSHVLPAMIRKFHEAKMNGSEYVELWGTGRPLREFTYVDDMADACVFLMNNYEEPEHINIGTGSEISITELAELIKEIVGYEGDVIFDKSKPDGVMRKLCDNEKLTKSGWEPRYSLREGIEETYRWYLSQERKRL